MLHVPCQDPDFGNLVTTATDTVTVTQASGTGILTGTLAKAAVSGIATFNDLSYDVVETMTLNVTSNGFTGIIGTAVTVIPVPVSMLAYGTPPSSPVTANSIWPVFEVRIEDTLGNLETGATDTVTVSLASGAGVLGGTLSKAAVGGIATFNDLAHDTAEGITLDVTAPGLPGVLGTPVTVDPAAAIEPPFTIVTLPDTEYYSESYPATFLAQTQWAVDNRVARNIVFTTQVGDCVRDASQTTQWQAADAAFTLLENVGMPYGFCLGDRDMDPVGAWNTPSATANYNSWFGEARFSGRPYYGGNDGLHNNDNHFELFNSGSHKFLIIHLEYNPGGPKPTTLMWIKDLVQVQYPDRWAIVSMHLAIEPGFQKSFTPQGKRVWLTLKVCPNFLLILSGDRHGEGQRTQLLNEWSVHLLLANYENRLNEETVFSASSNSNPTTTRSRFPRIPDPGSVRN